MIELLFYISCVFLYVGTGGILSKMYPFFEKHNLWNIMVYIGMTIAITVWVVTGGPMREVVCEKVNESVSERSAND